MSADHHDPQHTPGVGHYRPPIGIPAPNAGPRRGWLGALTSVAFHVLVVLLLLAPLLVSDAVRDQVLGAGSSGPAGGGGGGTGGAGGRHAWLDAREALHYVQVAPPAPAAPAPAPAPRVVPPPPTPKPPEPTPRPAPAPTPRPAATTPAPTAVAPTSGAAAVAAGGAGAGTGTDGSAGDGPGSGGGVGSGIGTGQGSGVGPGVGGDSAGGIFLPTPTETILPPFDAPASVRGQEIVVTFDIDERGKIVDVSFPPTRDGGYNRKLRERLQAYRFRPGHTPDGAPVRAKFQLSLFIS